MKPDELTPSIRACSPFDYYEWALLIAAISSKLAEAKPDADVLDSLDYVYESLLDMTQAAEAAQQEWDQ